jgi:hypothetical protein
MLTHGSLATLHFSAAVWMTATVWVMQMVHYPTFRTLGRTLPRSEFIQFVQSHGFWISFLVMPAMFLELGISGYWFFTARDTGQSGSFITLNFALVCLTWILTLAWSARAHQRFAQNGYDDATYQSLMRSNFARSLVWSLRLALLISLLVSQQASFTASSRAL